MAAQNGAAPLAGSSLAKDLFEDMGRKVEGLGTDGQAVGEETEQKIIDEIESLCMNCHEDVCVRAHQRTTRTNRVYRASRDYYLQRYPSSARS